MDFATPTSTSTTLPGSVITIVGGPNATADIPGPHNDAADFYGAFLGLAVIIVAILVARLLFGRGGGRVARR